MCGIAGIIDFQKNSDIELIRLMSDSMQTRGPDDSGVFFDDISDCQVALGHRRLSVLDLSNQGHQPYSFENIKMVYNGEVYNFAEIRDELKEYDYNFGSSSDTEVIIKAYHKWGIKAVDKFIGMFAIAFYDIDSEKIVLIRDRGGVKPLYWHWNNGLFLFASTLTAFKQHPCFQKKVSLESLSLFFKYGYIPQPYSIFEQTRKLRSGHFLEIDLKSQKIEELPYWKIEEYYSKPKLQLSDVEAIDHTEELLKSAFRYRMVSDVPVGVFLSGGYDSSVVTAILQKDSSKKLNTFTIGFEEDEFNESVYAAKVAEYLGTNHVDYCCSYKDALEILPELPHVYDEPFGDISAIPTILVSRLARKNVTVALSADGGDELFAGYDRYQEAINIHGKLSKVPGVLRNAASVTMNASSIISPFCKSIENFDARYDRLKSLFLCDSLSDVFKVKSQVFSDEDTKKMLRCSFDFVNANDADINASALDKMTMIDYNYYMQDDVLVKVDRATMSLSLEGREPMLDHRIAEFAARLPDNMKIRDGKSKWILRQIAHQYLPQEIMNRPKMGFGVPISSWLRNELRDIMMEYVNSETLENSVINTRFALKVRDNFLKNREVNGNKLWLLLTYQMWARCFGV